MLILTIIWLAIVDSINPTLIAINVILIISQNTKNVLAYIFGVFVTTIMQQLTLYFGLDKLLNKTLWHTVLNGWLLAFIGASLIVYGLYFWRNRYNTPNLEKWDSLSSFSFSNHIKYIIFGCATTIAETPTAFLLVFAVVEVQKLSTNIIWTLIYFCVYAVFYILPLILITIISIWYKNKFKKWLTTQLNLIFIRLNICLSLSLLAIGAFVLATGIKLLI